MTFMHLSQMEAVYLLETCCQDLEIDGDVEFLILASDGLWDVVPNEVSMPYTKFGTCTLVTLSSKKCISFIYSRHINIDCEM